MAKSQAKAATNGTPKADGEAASMPCYALSLTVENVRCFGPKQILNLSDKEGRPAQWTIILGENGTGKTTLLQSLVLFETVPISVGGSGRFEMQRLFASRYLGLVDNNTDFSFGLMPYRDQDTPVHCTLAHVSTLGLQDTTIHKSNISSWRSMENGSGVGVNLLPKTFAVFAYGAGRRLSPASLTAEVSDDGTGTLFSEHALLRNAEEWLLQLRLRSE